MKGCKSKFATNNRFDLLSNFQLLLKRAKLAERDISEWYKDLEMWSQLRHTHILQYDDSWITPQAHYLLSENARMCLSVCLRDMAPSKPHRTLYPQWLFHIVSALEVSILLPSGLCWTSRL